MICGALITILRQGIWIIEYSIDYCAVKSKASNKLEKNVTSVIGDSFGAEDDFGCKSNSAWYNFDDKGLKVSLFKLCFYFILLFDD